MRAWASGPGMIRSVPAANAIVRPSARSCTFPFAINEKLSGRRRGMHIDRLGDGAPSHITRPAVGCLSVSDIHTRDELLASRNRDGLLCGRKGDLGARGNEIGARDGVELEESDGTAPAIRERVGHVRRGDDPGPGWEGLGAVANFYLGSAGELNVGLLSCVVVKRGRAGRCPDRRATRPRSRR